MRRPSLPGLALLLVLGCAATRPRVLTGPGPDLDVAAWVSANPIGPFEDVKAVVVARTASTSHAIVQVRTRERPHVHENHDLTVHVVRGTGRMVLASASGGTAFEAAILPVRAGDSIVIGRGMIHWFENRGKEPAVAFATFTPPFDGHDNTTTPIMNALAEYLDLLGPDATARIRGTFALRADGTVMALGHRLPELH